MIYRGLLAAAAVSLAWAPLGAAGVSTEIRTDRDGSRTIVLSTEIATSRTNLWRALTTADGWKSWAAAAAWQVSAHPRIIETSYDAKAGPGGPQTIQQLFVFERAPAELAFRTIKAPAGFQDFDVYRNVVNRMRLTPLDSGRTRLRFESGPFPASAAGKRLFGFFEAGNRKTLENMAEVLSGAGHSQFATEE